MSACNSNSVGPAPSPLTTVEVRSFADPIAENMLQAMNTSNYTQYTRDFDEEFKKNLPHGAFETINSLRIETVGTYISKQFWQTVQKNDRITVAYRAKFTDETTDVIVTLYFKDFNGKWYIDGTYYDSPLMRHSGC
jgi:hypothetical protein